MRVITGYARGKRLHTLEGEAVRPTPERVKEAVFSSIQFDIEGRRFLDLFAGSGQMGIEALSRGAAEAVFVDARREAAALVRENLRRTRLSDRAQVVQADFRDYLSRCARQFDLIFLDPPYGSGLLEQAVETIARFDILRGHGIMVCESYVDETLPETAPPYTLHRTYRYGRIKLTVYRREGEEQP